MTNQNDMDVNSTVPPRSYEGSKKQFFRAVAISLFCSILANAQGPKPQVPKPETKAQSAPVPATTAHQMNSEDVSAFLDGIMPQQLAREDIAGAVISIVKDGKVIFAKGYGYSDVEKKKPVSPDDTLFRPGSISKLFTWTSVMQLVEQGNSIWTVT